MENKDIHNELSEKEVRDFLSKQLKYEQDECEHRTLIKDIENHIEYWQKVLIHAKNYLAILQIIQSKEWKEFDISDDIHSDRNTYFPFIGTEKEYKSLIQRLKKE